MPIDTTLVGNAPPRNARSARQGSPKQTPTQQRTEAVNGLFQLGSFACVMTGNYADAATIAEYGPSISTEVAELGRQNETIGKYIDYLNSAGPYAGLITAMLPFVLQLLANHKRLDYSKVPGLTSPEVLEAKIATEMRSKALQQMREAQRQQAEYDAQLRQMEEAMQGENGQPRE